MRALQALGLSQREACVAVRARRRSSREAPSLKEHEDARSSTRFTEVVQDRAEHGCRHLYQDYERNAIPEADEYVNYKRFRRIYRLAGLQIGQRRRRGRAKSCAVDAFAAQPNRSKAGHSISFTIGSCPVAHSGGSL